MIIIHMSIIIITLNIRMVKEEEEEEEEKRQSFYVRLKEKPLAKNDSAQ